MPTVSTIIESLDTIKYPIFWVPYMEIHRIFDGIIDLVNDKIFILWTFSRLGHIKYIIKSPKSLLVHKMIILKLEYLISDINIKKTDETILVTGFLKDRTNTIKNEMLQPFDLAFLQKNP